MLLANDEYIINSLYYLVYCVLLHEKVFLKLFDNINKAIVRNLFEFK